MDKNGVFYSAYGHDAIIEVSASVLTLQRTNPELGIVVIGDKATSMLDLDGVEHIVFEGDKYGREAKLNADLLTLFTNTLYLDADTRVRGDLSPIFNWLDMGFDFISTVSARQGAQWLWQADETERVSTKQNIGYTPIQLQGGVWAFRRTNAVRSFFAKWRKEYAQSATHHDQPSLTRAYYASAMKTLLVGHEFNGGAIVQHLFGKIHHE